MKKTFLFIFLSLFSIMAFAVNLAMVPNPPMEYVVKPGDTLWGIATKYLREPWQWPQLWYGNPQITNPDQLYPGDVLELYQHNGQYYLKRSRGGVVKLTPQVKVSQLDSDAIPTIPWGDIAPFLQGVQVISEPEIEKSAYVAALPDLATTAANPSNLFARNMHWPLRQYYSIFRVGALLKDPVTKQVLGINTINVADARLVQHGDPTVLTLTQSYEEIQLKDRILPMPPHLSPSDFYPQPPAVPVKGQIISIIGEPRAVAESDVVIINRGRINGLKRGDVLAIYRKGKVVADPMYSKNHHEPNYAVSSTVSLPNERIGEMLLFRIFSQVSYGLIMQSKTDINKFDIVTNP